jgi:SAM-dependent methyltransferase
MIAPKRWKEAQAAENEYWTGLSAPTVRQILHSNESMAKTLNSWVPESPSPAVEIGVGGLGVGLLGFVPGIQVRIGVDPLPLVQPSCEEGLLREIQSLRDTLHFVRSSGEALPFQDGCAGLAVCFNVLDHVSDAPQVIAEISRILCPGGLFFLCVDTFSYLGLAKWYLWTKPRHANEILVRAHPYRFLEHQVKKMCCGAGFELVRTASRGPLDLLFGHSIPTPFLFRKSSRKNIEVRV